MYNAGFEFKFVKGVPEALQNEAAGFQLELQQEELKNTLALQQKKHELGLKYQRELRQIIGEEHLEKYYEFRFPLRQKIQALSADPKHTLEHLQPLQEARLDTAKQLNAFYEEINLKKEAMMKLNKRHKQDLRKLTSKILELPEKPNFIIPKKDLPKKLFNPSPWDNYTPPYAGYAWSYSWSRSDESAPPHIYSFLDPASGELGSYIHIGVSGADDDDSSNVIYATTMRFWYRIPAFPEADAGRIEVWIRLAPIETTVSYNFYNEPGWSDAYCDQESDIRLRVIRPRLESIQRKAILDYHRSFEPFSTVRGTVINPYPDYDSYWAHLFSAEAYETNTWVLLEVGVEDRNSFWSDDVSVDSWMAMHWRLERVYVRTNEADPLDIG